MYMHVRMEIFYMDVYSIRIYTFYIQILYLIDYTGHDGQQCPCRNVFGFQLAANN